MQFVQFVFSFEDSPTFHSFNFFELKGYSLIMRKLVKSSVKPNKYKCVIAILLSSINKLVDFITTKTNIHNDKF